ncbi:metalloregulator ArsR/SmtB family transcription factor [Aestuariimicrobium sp. p3-SID1156]|uniref:ArsR/SmtB family transcription factor n=1 Tax=Aestuariimicrobium sp. p3-SID1156 TaxID=2916038 RepID=UPI00223BE389|nr:metalloregulator ArsR/SmtB family transcription factor [Aestuariimicrobium sp. p3-SID1156]MCT1459693.1 metalloregulator ArsR/SmtB family transcription factor [Aestuariimicrobium sp. p3-SID1156]
MPLAHQLVSAAELFRALGSPARLAILQELGRGPLSVSALSEKTGMSQPLVSQHLRVLRSAGAVSVEHSGRERINQLADEHVHHIVQDTLAHVGHAPSPTDSIDHPEEHDMTDQTTHEAAEHTFEEHTHGEHCGHDAIEHGDHVDFLHDGHRHAAHDDHYDEH